MIVVKRLVGKAVEMGMINEEQEATIMEWLKTPWTWAARRGLIATTREN